MGKNQYFYGHFQQLCQFTRGYVLVSQLKSTSIGQRRHITRTRLQLKECQASSRDFSQYRYVWVRVSKTPSVWESLVMACHGKVRSLKSFLISPNSRLDPGKFPISMENYGEVKQARSPGLFGFPKANSIYLQLWLPTCPTRRCFGA